MKFLQLWLYFVIVERCSAKLVAGFRITFVQLEIRCAFFIPDQTLELLDFCWYRSRGRPVDFQIFFERLQIANSLWHQSVSEVHQKSKGGSYSHPEAHVCRWSYAYVHGRKKVSGTVCDAMTRGSSLWYVVYHMLVSLQIVTMNLLTNPNLMIHDRDDLSAQTVKGELAVVIWGSNMDRNISVPDFSALYWIGLAFASTRLISRRWLYWIHSSIENESVRH